MVMSEVVGGSSVKVSQKWLKGTQLEEPERTNLKESQS